MRAQAELTVDHNQGELTVLHPFLGRNDYRGLKEQARMQGARLATLPDAASVIHDAYVVDPKNQYAKEIQTTMEKGGVYTATKSLWVPNEGVYVFPDNDTLELPEALRDRIGKLNPNELEQFLTALKEQDGLVGFAKFGSFDTGILDSSLKLAKNAYLRAFGDETAEKLAEVSDKHRQRPYLGANQNINWPLVTVSGLGSDWGLDDGRLGVVGDDRGDGSGSSGFGVCETGEAS